MWYISRSNKVSAFNLGPIGICPFVGLLENAMPNSMNTSMGYAARELKAIELEFSLAQ